MNYYAYNEWQIAITKGIHMEWLKLYKGKKSTMEEAVAMVKSGHRLYSSANAAAPSAFMNALAKRGHELENVQIYHMLLIGDDPFGTPDLRERFFHSSYFIGSADRPAVNAGTSAYIPVHLHEIPKVIRMEPPVDISVVHTSPPDEHGFLSLGVEVVATKASAETSKCVIAQVNNQMPRTLGDSFIHISQIHALVEVDQPLPILDNIQITDTERKIGKYIADMIDDGSTLQLGIGGIPNAVLELLEGKRDIGIHTEMVSDGILQAVQKGIVTGTRKSLHPGKIIGTFILGSANLYGFVDDNPFLEMHPVDYTNNPWVVAKNDNMVAVNSALEVDITGQVCSDSIGTYIYSGFGGQLDFIRGAGAAKNGKPIIALPATAKNDQISRIVPTLKVGSGVVTTRADVHYVVTEYGIAVLYGKNLQQRARALINVAHPKFREELEKAAWERKILSHTFTSKSK